MRAVIQNEKKNVSYEHQSDKNEKCVFAIGKFFATSPSSRRMRAVIFFTFGITSLLPPEIFGERLTNQSTLGPYGHLV